jgi:hypothetical protein
MYVCNRYYYSINFYFSITMKRHNKKLSEILDYTEDIDYHLEKIREYASENREFEELISEDINEIDYIVEEIYYLTIETMLNEKK